MSFSIHIHKYADTVIQFEQTKLDLNDVIKNLSFKLPTGAASAGNLWFIGVSIPSISINVVNNTIEIDGIERFSSDTSTCVYPATKEASTLFANYIKKQLIDKYSLKCNSIENEVDYDA